MGGEARILKDESADNLLRKQGYIIIPLLSDGDIEALNEFFDAHHQELPAHFYASAHVADTDFRKRMSEEISRIVGPLFDEIKQDGDLLGGSYISKPAGNGGLLPPHADWNIVEEPAWRSFNLWIPLVDTRPENGAVYIVPKSHLWPHTFRGPNVPNFLQNVQNEVWDYLQPLSMKAGDALLYDHRLVHASPLNQSTEKRLACVLGILPKGADLRYYYAENEKISSYAADVDFHFRTDPAKGPDGLEKISEIDYDFHMLSANELEDLVREHSPELIRGIPPSKQRSIFQKIAGIFGKKY